MMVVFSVRTEALEFGQLELARANMDAVPRAGEIVNLQLSGSLEPSRYVRLLVKSVEWDAYAHRNFQYDTFGLATLFVSEQDDEAKAWIAQCIQEELEHE